VAHSRTNRVLLLGRSFMADNDPKPTAELIKNTLKLYPYTPGGYGTSVATLLEGTVRPGAPLPLPETRFIEASGKAFNTIPPSDVGFFEVLHSLVQDEPAEATDAETMGQLAAIGIVKGQPFTPDERLRQLLEEAAAVGNATARALMFQPPASDEGIKPFPPTGARRLNLRTMFFYGYTGITPAMCMRLTNIGSQYLVAFKDADDRFFDRARSYIVTLPPDIPEARFWSLTLYDNETRSMLQTPQRFPRAGSQSYPTPAAAANPDGSTTIHLAPEQPDRVADGNWIQIRARPRRLSPPGSQATLVQWRRALTSGLCRAWRTTGDRDPGRPSTSWSPSVTTTQRSC
jgi:hypothetical protein